MTIIKGSVDHARYDITIRRELRCDKLIVGGQEVRGGEDSAAQASGAVHAQKEVLVQPGAERDAGRLDALLAAEPGSLLYVDENTEVAAIAPEQAGLFALGCRPGLPPQLVAIDERVADLQALVSRIDALEALVQKLSVTPKKTTSRRGRGASSSAAKKKPEDSAEKE